MPMDKISFYSDLNARRSGPLQLGARLSVPFDLLYPEVSMDFLSGDS